ncbi:MAG TPA: DUF5615 family PIN-like protein [Pirellulales bacterium]|jgi:hypothetical protein|nr:DUF5615 family PIN-like protein [Pirellulales bacterium]
MFKLLANENLNGDILRGLLLRQPQLDIVRAQDVGLYSEDDREVLDWAAREERILLTHDGASMPDHAYERVDRGEKMPGVFVISERLSVGQAIEEVLLTIECSEASEWTDRVVRLPL